MSDRIDELVRRKQLIVCLDCPHDIPCTSCEPSQRFDELATIARDAEARARRAEAMFERLVKYAADCGECPRTRYDEDEDGCRECLDSIRRIAHKAVRQDT